MKIATLINHARNKFYNFIYKGVAIVNGSQAPFSGEILKILRTYYLPISFKQTDPNRVIVYLTDKLPTTGLADRLRTVRTAYACAAENNRKFYVYHLAGGFRLEEYLEPNEVDWRIEENDINFGLNKVALLLKYDTIPQFPLKDREYHLYNSCGIISELKLTPEQQQKYTDRAVHKKLFKPSARLSELVQAMMERVGLQEDAYVVVHLRFTNFFEQVELGGAVTSSESERLQMLCDVHQVIDKIYHATGCMKVLLCSDSNTFLNYKHPDYISILPGTNGHISKYNNRDVIDKAFIDLFVMSKAKAVYSIRGKNIYGGGFSREAAIIGDKPFIEVPLHEGSREGFIGTY